MARGWIAEWILGSEAEDDDEGRAGAAGLARLHPSLGGQVSHAAVIGEAIGPGAGLSALDRIENDRIDTFQPAMATRAHLLARLGRNQEAASCYEKAVQLTRETPLRDWLQRRLRDVVRD